MNQINIRCQARLNATIEELYTLIPQIRQDRKSGKSPLKHIPTDLHESSDRTASSLHIIKF